MSIRIQHRILLISFGVLLPLVCLIHLVSGQNDIGLSSIFSSLTNYDESSISHVIARNVRLPRMITALFAGGSLAISGLLMQTLFRNPLAGPYVLGINSGASLLVALSIMTGVEFFGSELGITLNALLGSFLFGILILFLARFARQQITLLLAGIMIGSFTSAFIAIIQTGTLAEQLKVYTLWNLGSLQQVELGSTPIVVGSSLFGLLCTFFISKKLNLLILGESEARMMGVNSKTLRYLLIAITALLVGVVTAYCGPIAFVGLAVPNIVRIIFKTQNHILLSIASFLIGAIFLLIVDAGIQFCQDTILIPINAVTSLIGAPLVVYLLFRRIR